MITKEDEIVMDKAMFKRDEDLLLAYNAVIVMD